MAQGSEGHNRALHLQHGQNAGRCCQAVHADHIIKRKILPAVSYFGRQEAGQTPYFAPALLKNPRFYGIISPQSPHGTRGQKVRHLPGGSSDLIHRCFCPLGRMWKHINQVTHNSIDFLETFHNFLFLWYSV